MCLPKVIYLNASSACGFSNVVRSIDLTTPRLIPSFINFVISTMKFLNTFELGPSLNIQSKPTPWNEMFCKNANKPKFLFICISYFPISKNLPFAAKQRTDACNLSSVNEFKTTSTPFPFVTFIICLSKVTS